MDPLLITVGLVGGVYLAGKKKPVADVKATPTATLSMKERMAAGLQGMAAGAFTGALSGGVLGGTVGSIGGPLGAVAGAGVGVQTAGNIGATIGFVGGFFTGKQPFGKK